MSRPEPAASGVAEGSWRGRLALCLPRDEDLAAVRELVRSEGGAVWTSKQIEAERDRGGLLLLRGAEGVAAYCCVRLVADELHVEGLAVTPERRRQGLAQGLLRRVLALARSRATAVAILEVRASNRAAQRLYASMGFASCGRRADYYNEPVEDAIVMKKTLSAM